LEKEKDILFSYPDNQQNKVKNPAILQHIHLSRDILERSFRQDLNL
jgi:hypothetical protein